MGNHGLRDVDGGSPIYSIAVPVLADEVRSGAVTQRKNGMPIPDVCRRCHTHAADQTGDRARANVRFFEPDIRSRPQGTTYD